MRRGRSGGSRFGCLLLFFAAGALWAGGQGVYTAMKNRKPTSMTMREYLRTKPNVEWLELKDAVVFLPGAAHFYNQFGGDSMTANTEIYVPLYPAMPESTDVPSRVLLKTGDPKALELYNTMMRLTSETEIEKLYEARREDLTGTRAVTGLVQFGIDIESDDLEKLRIAANTDDFIVLAEGAKPSAGEGAAILVVGVVLLLLAGWQLAKGNEPSA